MHPTGVTRAAAAAGRNLFQVAQRLPLYGLQQAFGRKMWRRNGHGDDTYWKLTRVVARKQGSRLKAYGVLTWHGQTDPKEREIRGSHKREWRWIPSPLPRPDEGKGE